MSKSDVVLINPGMKKKIYGTLSERLSGIEPPIWIGLLAAFLREKNFSVKVIDADAENLDIKHIVDQIVATNPFLVCIGLVGANPSAASTPKMAALRCTLESFFKKKIDAKTLAFGIHPSALPERTLKEELVDFVCRGEPFYPVSQLLEQLKADKSNTDWNIKGLWYLKDGTLVKHGWAPIVKNLDTLPFVAWDLLPMEKYRAHNWHCFGHIDDRKPYGVIYSSLGCPFNCYYCNIHTLYNGQPNIRFRSPESVIKEIDYLVNHYQIKHLKICDELFVLNKRRMFQICDLLIERNYNLNIWAYARVDTVSYAILRKLKAAGVNWLCYGIEAGSHKVRKGIAKGRFDRATVKKAIDMTHIAGIHVIGNFMFGLPDDNLLSMQKTFMLAQELNCEYVNFYSTMAYPGSALYDDALKQGLPLPNSWIGFSQFSPETLPLPTKYLSSQEVLDFRDKAFIKYYSRPEYLDMIARKFGQETVDHISQMLKVKLKRNILTNRT